MSTVQQHPCKHVQVIMDADELQHVQSPSQCTLMEALVNHLPNGLVMFVQNIHHLPFGPFSTIQSPSAGLLAAWKSVRGIVCVSEFVASYIKAHLPSTHNSSHASTSNITVVSLAGLGVFGKPPFPNLAANVVQNRGKSTPVVGMLKLTHEKGARIFFDMAKRMSHVKFLAVSADPDASQVAALIPNMQTVPPTAALDSLLRQMTVVVVPSLLHEAFGMVVIDAMLRGIPVIVSNAGALPEVGQQAAVVVPVNIMQVGQHQSIRACFDRHSGDSDTQDTDAWVAAVYSLLSDREAYRKRSEACRLKALQYLDQGAASVQHLLEWLHQDGNNPS
eukprot:jgi/Chrzof1/3374/Cz12g23030.t1